MQPDAPNTTSSKGDIKREATYPLDSQMSLQEKKARHNTGNNQPSHIWQSTRNIKALTCMKLFLYKQKCFFYQVDGYLWPH